jgi:hypothetical protein
MNLAASATSGDYLSAFRGTFFNLLSWDDLGAFWSVVREHAGAGWYLTMIGQPIPTRPATTTDVCRFIEAIDRLLHNDHREDYCGIVYVDSKTKPTFVKIYDPNHLGSSCGFSQHPPLPGWVMSLLPPAELTDRRTPPQKRIRFWEEFWKE